MTYSNTAKNCIESSVPSTILVLGTNVNYGTYIGEILKAEGFAEFRIENPNESQITTGYMLQFDVVILGESLLVCPQKFIDFVKQGGNLIAFRPSGQLADIFGITFTDSTLSDAYLKIDTNTGIGAGLTSETMKFHSAADLYNLNGASQIAVLYSDSSTCTTSNNPAVVFNSYGSGHAAAFAYNLAGSIVFTRQGNYKTAGQEKDGIYGIREIDMFAEPQPDGWNDRNKNHLNQADEQMRLLSHVIEKMSTFKKPIPRFWYFPNKYKASILWTDDGEDSTEADFNSHIKDMESKGAHMTIYIKSAYIPAATVADWVSRGHETSCHFDDTEEATNPTWSNMNNVAATTMTNHQNAYGITPKTIRNHWVVWCGENSTGGQEFAAQAMIEANHGLELDCNYYHYDNGSALGHFLGDAGNYTGSGLLMKFADSNGNILNIYQSLTQLPDEMWEKGNFYNAFRTLLNRSLDNEGYSFLNVNTHTDRWNVWSKPECMQMLDYANQRGIPVWTAQQALDFVKMRDSASFKDISWSDNRLTFLLCTPLPGQGLTIMVPATYEGNSIGSITIDGTDRTFTLMMVKGREYALVTVSGGSNYNLVVTYTAIRSEVDK